jgi:hypothetical protein
MLSFPMARGKSAHTIQETQRMKHIIKNRFFIASRFAGGIGVPCRIASAGSD